MLGAIDVGPLVSCLIWPRLYSVTVLLVILPIACVDSPIVMHILTLPVSFVVEPLALINVTVGMDQAADTICFAVLPLTLVE